MGASSALHPLEEVQALAALRGWAHPDVVLRVQALAEAEAAFGARLVEAVADAPESIETERLTVRSRGVRCPWFGYDRQAFDCALELDVSGSDAYRFDPWLVWPDGSHGREFPANAGEQPVLMAVPGPHPVALRVWTDDGPVWMRL